MPESDLFKEISILFTEQRNPRSENIDVVPVKEILKIINEEDKLVACAVEKEIDNIAKAVELVAAAFRKGGRLFYFGAGTSGRLGILDAAECPPTFGASPDMVQGIIAGGKDAVFKAQEGAEDKESGAEAEFEKHGINSNDVVCGVAASGRTPFVKGALKTAKEKGIASIIISTVPKEQIVIMGIEADIFINPVVGPEVITGSTRMKSGTAQKLVLNMITTASMVLLGKTYGNVMVDLQMTNKKLRERAKGIIMKICGVDYDKASELLEQSGSHVKTALVMGMLNLSKEEAQKALEKAGGFIKKAVE